MLEPDSTARLAFGVPLLTIRLPGADAVNARLLPLILARRAAEPASRVERVLGGWRSSPDLHVWAADEVAPLFDAARALAARASVDGDGRPYEGAWEVPKCQGNVIGPGGWARRHRHYEGLWACVYYVDDGGGDEGGELQLLESSPEEPGGPALPSLGRFAAVDVASPPVLVRPEPGLLVMFPVHVTHQVRHHRGDRERVSVGFNLAAVSDVSLESR